MTREKEFAVALVDSFMNIQPPKLSDYSKIYLPTAKECARITVNFMLDEHFGDDSDYATRRWALLEKVKKEIDNI